ncbi:hypothetical protein [Lacipirellula limnantheis]|nr:hypothetical protein [Lacipirellula limnantheis]
MLRIHSLLLPYHSSRFDRMQFNLLLSVALVGLAALSGCSDKPAVAPVSGKVTYNGKPMPYGSVGFQPAQGQPAGAAIQPDGTFRLSTFAEFDGAIIGPHKVKVTCYASQRPSQQAKKTPGEFVLGESLIPAQYTFLDQSGLTAEVPAEGNDSIVIELSGPEKTFPQ